MNNDSIITQETVGRKRKIPCSEIDRQIIAKVSRKMESLRPIVPARRQSAVDSGIVGQYRDASSGSAKMDKARGLGGNSASVSVSQYKDMSSESAKMDKAHSKGEISAAFPGGQCEDASSESAKMGKAHGMGEKLAAVPGGQYKDSSEAAKKAKAQSMKETLAAYPDNYDGKHAKLILLCKVAHEMEEKEEAIATKIKLLKEKKKAEEEEGAAK